MTEASIKLGLCVRSNFSKMEKDNKVHRWVLRQMYSLGIMDTSTFDVGIEADEDVGDEGGIVIKKDMVLSKDTNNLACWLSKDIDNCLCTCAFLAALADAALSPKK